MKLPVFAAVAALGVALSGCASIIDGSTQRITVATPPVTGAHCVLSNGEGQWSVVTPGHVTVKRSKKDMSVRCSKEGYQDVVGTMPSDLNGWALANFALAIVPLGVDAWTGAINDYDDTYKLNMSQGYGAPATQQPYPSYPSTPAPAYQDQGPDQYQDQYQDQGSPPPAPDSSPYPAPTQQYDDQSPSYPDSLPPDSAPSYPDNSQSAPGTLPPL